MTTRTCHLPAAAPGAGRVIARTRSQEARFVNLERAASLRIERYDVGLRSRDRSEREAAEHGGRDKKRIRATGAIACASVFPLSGPYVAKVQRSRWSPRRR